MFYIIYLPLYTIGFPFLLSRVEELFFFKTVRSLYMNEIYLFIVLVNNKPSKKLCNILK